MSAARNGYLVRTFHGRKQREASGTDPERGINTLLDPEGMAAVLVLSFNAADKNLPPRSPA